MAGGLNITELSDFTGGINYRADQFQLSSFESPDMLNVEIDPRGGVFSRGAQRRLNTTAVPVGGTWNPEKLYPFNGSTNYLFLTNNNKVYKSTGSNFTVLESSAGVDVVSTSSHGACMAQWGTKMYMVTGSGGTGSYVWNDGATYATVLTPSGTNPNPWQATADGSNKMPTSEHAIVHANKMFVANTSEAGVSYPNRLRYSLENVPDNFDATHFFDINGGGQGITGLAVVNGQLVIFKPSAIYVLFGYTNSNFRIVELTNRIGCFSHHALAQTESGVYWYSNGKGLYYYNGSTIQDMFEQIRPAIDLGYINASAGDAITVSWIGRRVWLSVPYSTVSPASVATTNFIFDPSVRGGVFTRFQTSDSYGLVSGCEWSDSSNNEYRLMCHPTQPYVMKVDLYNNDYDNISGTDVAFTSYYKTRWFDGGSYMQKKMFRRPDFVVKESATPQNITVNVYHDFAEGEGNERKTFNLNQTPTTETLIWGSGNWGQNWSTGAASSTVVIGRNLGLARSIQLEFVGPAAQRWGINSIGLKYQARRVKG